ncbi:MAG: DUF4129 domain-containing protein [Cyanothece sp. SIO2G6]|nr:DUF4129 domain-containing protein [Cyanothece sp. SIO2G6]
MANGSYAKDGLGWQIQQAQRRFSEWAEVQFTNATPDVDPGPLPGLPSGVTDFLLILFLVIVSGALIWLLVKLFAPDILEWINRKPIVRPTSSPSRDTPSSAVWVKRSHQWQQQGNYREACRALYMAMIERLHETQQVPRKLSRTDGEYRVCVSQLNPPQAYQLLINVHEQLCFGDRDISADLLQRCQQAYQGLK